MLQPDGPRNEPKPKTDKFPASNGENQIVWEVERIRRHWSIVPSDKQFIGTLIFDVDGTLTVEGNKYRIHPAPIEVLARFLVGGGRVVFCTGATCGRIERTVLAPLLHCIEERAGIGLAGEIFPRVFMMPENGSALLVFKRVVIVECEPRFDWHRYHELPVPDKATLRQMLEREFQPKYLGSKVWSNDPDDGAPRDYIVSFSGLKEGSPRDVIKAIEAKQSSYPDIDWSKIRMKAARTTVDFVHAESGKTASITWLFKEYDDFDGPVLGFGDLGDEFAERIPTLNVNRHKPNEFRLRKMPAIDLTGGWRILEPDRYVVLGPRTEKGAVVRDLNTDKVIQVLRDERGTILYAREEPKTETAPAAPPGQTPENAPPRPASTVLQPCSLENGGRPVEILPIPYTDESGKPAQGPGGKPVYVGDAGEASAWVLQGLMDKGYFRPNRRAKGTKTARK